MPQDGQVDRQGGIVACGRPRDTRLRIGSIGIVGVEDCAYAVLIEKYILGVKLELSRIAHGRNLVSADPVPLDRVRRFASSGKAA